MSYQDEPCEAAAPEIGRVAHSNKQYMSPKDERMVELAIEVGQGRKAREYNTKTRHALEHTKRQLEEMTNYARNLEERVERAERVKSNWESAYHKLETRYQNFRKKHSPKKAVAKKKK